MEAIDGIVNFLVSYISRGRVQASLLHTSSVSGLAGGTLLLPPQVQRSGCLV